MQYHYYLRAYLVFVLSLAIALLFLFVTSKPKLQTLKSKRKLVNTFLLSDYCLSTESRHTRHLSMPELIAPFQDFPGYHEHFPSSSFISPRNIRSRN